MTGELAGDFVIDWLKDDGRKLGSATLITGNYTAANFTFGRGTAELLSADDELLGHTAIISGTAKKGGTSTNFTIVVDSPAGRDLVGVPFEAKVSGDSTGELKFRFHTVDPLGDDTLFDGLDFSELDSDGDGVLRIEPEVVEVERAYNEFRRVFQTHNHYIIEFQE